MCTNLACCHFVLSGYSYCVTVCFYFPFSTDVTETVTMMMMMMVITDNDNRNIGHCQRSQLHLRQFFMPVPGHTGSRSHNVLNLSVGLFFVILFVCLLPHLWSQYFKNKLTNFDANWYEWSTGQGHKIINLWGQEVRVQGHSRLETDFDA